MKIWVWVLWRWWWGDEDNAMMEDYEDNAMMEDWGFEEIWMESSSQSDFDNVDDEENDLVEDFKGFKEIE